MQIRQVKLLPILFVFIVIFLQYRLWIEPGGVSDMFHLKKQLSDEMQVNDKLKKQNDKLLSEVQRLQKNEDAVEARARHELGMIKKGETFYQVVR